MTFAPRSQYEFGDPVGELLAREERTDHRRARARGQRLLLLADALVDVLAAHAQLRDAGAARRDLFHELAQALYSGVAIDVPDFMDERSLEALRRGRSE